MNMNLAPLDRALRIGGGFFFLASPVLGFDNPVYWLGALAVASGLAGICPIYKLVGFSSCTPTSYRHRKTGIELRSEHREGMATEPAHEH